MPSIESNEVYDTSQERISFCPHVHLTSNKVPHDLVIFITKDYLGLG